MSEVKSRGIRGLFRKRELSAAGAGISNSENGLITEGGEPEKKARKFFRKGRKLSKKKKKLLIVIIILIIAAVAAGVFFLHQKQSAGGKSAYTEEAVEYRTITKSLSDSGTLQPANSYTVTTLLEGDIISASFEEGDTIEADTVLYQIDSSDKATDIEKAQLSVDQAERSYSSAADKQYIKAESSGTVDSLEVSVGDSVSQGDTIAVIRQSAIMTLTVPFPADDAANFYSGESATVTLDGSFETLTGTIKSISGSNIVGTGNSISRNVTISVKNPGGLGTSQTATASVAGVNCSGSGTFKYSSESTVTASSSGTITAVNVNEGGSVSKNQVIVTIGGDDIDDQLQSASDSLKNAQLSMKSTQSQLEDYTITSPISGTVVDKQYKAGDTIEAGTTLCTIYDLSYLEMTLDIDELDVGNVAVGQTVNITADAVDGSEYTGVVTKVSVAGTTTDGVTSYPVTVQIDETEGLLPGMNVDANIVIESVENVLTVPAAAIQRGNMVLVTKDSPSAANAVTSTDSKNKDTTGEPDAGTTGTPGNSDGASGGEKASSTADTSGKSPSAAGSSADSAPDGYVYITVETGVSDDDYVQITSGLQEGDTIAYTAQTGSSSDTQQQTMMMGGMSGGAAGGMSGGGMPSGGGGGGMPSGGGGPA